MAKDNVEKETDEAEGEVIEGVIDARVSRCALRAREISFGAIRSWCKRT